MRKEFITQLIDKVVAFGTSVWADLGSGDGAFTLELRELGGPDIEIFSMDKDIESLREQEETFEKRFGKGNIEFINADFTEPFEFPPLDGILMANSLHFVNDQYFFLDNLWNFLKPGGKLLLVEYDTDFGNPFIPYPLSFETFK
jgi:ubiquinone/menaquinone biosynthesis C-methylase UbiE